jgi:hypothetical protein
MHPIQDLFLESFSYVLQFDMHFYMHSYVDKNFILVKSGCYKEQEVNQYERHKTQDFFPKFGHPQRMPTSQLWSSQRAGSLSTLIHSERSPRSSLASTIKSPQRRGQYKLSGINHNLADSRTT